VKKEATGTTLNRTYLLDLPPRSNGFIPSRVQLERNVTSRGRQLEKLIKVENLQAFGKSDAIYNNPVIKHMLIKDTTLFTNRNTQFEGTTVQD